MESEKDIRFTEKRVDESWKQQASVDRGSSAPKSAQSQASKQPPSAAIPPQQSSETSPLFLNFLHSLGFQVLMHLGEMAYPETGEKVVNLEAAREMIDVLIELRNKTRGNTSPEEFRFFDSVLPELQMKFSQAI